MVYKLFQKKTSGGAVKSETMPNQQLDDDLHKLVIKKFKKRKIHWIFDKCLTKWTNFWRVYITVQPIT